MPGSDKREFSTSRLAEAGVILRSLTPSALGTLYLLVNHDMRLQSEMAERIGCRRPSISRYLQSLEFEDLPISLTRKQGQHYTVTESGEQIFGYIDSMLERLRIDLHDIEWSNADDQEKIKDKLSPLCDSRSTRPFLILDSIRVRIGFFDTPDSVSVKDVITDVRARQQEINESVTSKHIRETVWRFDEKEAIEFDGSQITLRDKGKEHVRLLQHLTQILEDERGEGENKSLETISSESEPSRIGHLLDPRPFRGGSQTVNTSRSSTQANPVSRQDSPIIVPAYRLAPSNELESDEQSLMLPFTSLTVEELVDYANQLDQEFDADTLLDPYWALRTGDELLPLGPAQLTLGTLRETE